jgi:hypothetical protein
MVKVGKVKQGIDKIHVALSQYSYLLYKFKGSVNEYFMIPVKKLYFQ